MFFIDAKAYPLRGSRPSGRESAFWKADGKHQGLRALDPGTLYHLTSMIKQLQAGYKCRLLQLLYGKMELPWPGQVVQEKRMGTVSTGDIPTKSRVYLLHHIQLQEAAVITPLEASWHSLSGQH